MLPRFHVNHAAATCYSSPPPICWLTAAGGAGQSQIQARSPRRCQGHPPLPTPVSQGLWWQDAGPRRAHCAKPTLAVFSICRLGFSPGCSVAPGVFQSQPFPLQRLRASPPPPPTCSPPSTCSTSITKATTKRRLAGSQRLEDLIPHKHTPRTLQARSCQGVPGEKSGG